MKGTSAAPVTPAAPRAGELRECARRIRLVVLDVDGVLTDGGIYLGNTGGTTLEFKRYDIQDGLGVKFLQDAGLRVAIVTGRVSESVRLRAAELGITDLAQDTQAQKLSALRAICDRHEIAMSEVAFVGDDWPDVAVLREVGLPVAVANAVPEVKGIAKLKLGRTGGHGAVREFAEWLLLERGEWAAVTARYVAERSAQAVAL